MKRRSALLVLAILALGATAAAAAPPARPEILPVAEVRAGMEVTAWTVFRGDTAEPFRGRVTGVVQSFRGPGRDVILVEFTDERVRHTGIVHGMSGSPVYAGERLLGALSLVLSPFPKDPVGGVTPFESMQKDGLLEPRESGTGGDSPTLPGREDGALLRPLAPPLTVTGLPAGAVGALRPRFDDLGLEVVQAMSGATSPAASAGDAAHLTAGSSAAAVLALGDAAITATGTVTHRDGDRLIGFGHPFLALGKVRFGMAPAEVVTMLADQTYSYKVTNVGPLVGTWTLDRTSGVTGRIGALPTLIPLAVTVRAGDRLLADHRYQVIEDHRLTPVLIQLLTLGSLTGRRGYEHEATLRLNGTIELRDGLRLPVADSWTVTAHPQGDAPLMPILELGEILTQLYLNPFEQAAITSVDLQFELEPPVLESLETVRVATSPVPAGRDAHARLGLRDRSGGRRSVDVAIPIPRWAAGRPLVVRVADKEAMRTDAQSLGATAERASRFEQLVTALGERPRGDRIHVQLLAHEPGAVLRHRAAGPLPSTVERVLAHDPSAYRPQPRRVLWQAALPTAGKFVGVAERPIEVRP